MSDKTTAEYEARIAHLEALLDLMRQQPVRSVMGTVSRTRPGMTVMGLDEMILQVGIDDTIGYVNAHMAKLLSLPDRREVLGTPLSQWDNGPLGDGLLLSLVTAARTSGQGQVMERSYPGFDTSLLPSLSETRPNCDPMLSFVATSQKGRVHVVVQEVTKLRWLELTFSRFVSPKVIEHMQGMPTEEFLSMERREVTVVFCDMRGFTSLCQQEEPERVQNTVNTFLENMVQCVEAAALAALGLYEDKVPVPRLSFKDLGPRQFKNVAEPVRVVSVAVKA